MRIKLAQPSDALPSDFRIVQISDIHFSIINGIGMATQLKDLIQKLHPDLILSTGDLTDSGLCNEKRAVEILETIKAPYGKYAVPGNHEFYAGIEKATLFTNQAGFQMLRNEKKTIGSWITLIGLDDPAGKYYSASPVISEEELLKNAPSQTFRILLKHQPLVNQTSIGLFDLQLSGHVHKGQIFPFSLITDLFYRYPDGFFCLNSKSQLYVSRGTGTWGPPIRFLAPPEITLFEFNKDQP